MMDFVQIVKTASFLGGVGGGEILIDYPLFDFASQPSTFKMIDEQYSEEIVKDIEDTQKIVAEVLRECEEARNSDRFLFQKVAEKKGLILIIPKGLPSFETMRRSRQKIQEAGEYLPTDGEVAYRRLIKENVMRSYYGERSGVYQKYLHLKYGVV
jgi:hypothetical protein